MAWSLGAASSAGASAGIRRSGVAARQHRRTSTLAHTTRDSTSAARILLTKTRPPGRMFQDSTSTLPKYPASMDLRQEVSPRLPLTPGPRADRRRRDICLALLGTAGFLVAISWQVVLPVLPVHLSRLGYTAAQVGLLVSLLSLAMGGVELEVGRIAGILGGRWILNAGLLSHAAAMLWVALARPATMIGGALAAVGAARAMVWAPLHASVADTATAEARGRAFGVFWSMTSVGFLAGPAVGGLVAARTGDRGAFYLGTLISLLALPVVAAITDQGRPPLRVTAAGAGTVLRSPVFFRLCLANHLHYAVTAIWTTFLPLYAVSQGLSVLDVGEVFAVQGLTYALVQLPTGRMVDRWGPERLILPALVGRSFLSLLVPLLHHPGALVAAGAAYGVAGGLVPVTFTTLVARLSPRERYTTAMGVYNSSGDLGFFVGPLAGGMAALLGITAPFFLCGPLGLAAVGSGLGVAVALRQGGLSAGPPDV